MKTTTSNLRLLSICIGLAVLLAAPGIASAIQWTNKAGDGKWSSAGNWEPAQVPGPGDSAELNNGDDVAIDIPVTIANLTTAFDVRLHNCCEGAASLTVTNRFDLKGGSIYSGGGPFGKGTLTLNIPESGTLAISGTTSFRKFLTCIVNNAGRIEWSGESVNTGGLILNNTGVFEILTDAGFGGDGGVINNAENGLIIKKAGSVLAQLALTVNNKGVIQVASGTLQMGKGTSTGEFKVANGKKLLFTISHTFNEPARFVAVADLTSGNVTPGVVTLANDMKFSGHINTSADLELGSGLSGGNGAINRGGGEASFEGPGRLIWTAGDIYGKFTLAEDFRTILIGASDKVFGTGSVVTNRGTMDWYGPGIFRGGDSQDTFFNEGTFNLQAGGVFISNLGFSAPTFENRGTLNTYPNGTSETASARLRNSGVVNIGGFGHAGILKIGNGYEQKAEGTLYMEVGGANAATPQFDQLIGGSKALDGTLNVDTINNFTPAKDARFTLIDSHTGKFARVFTPGGPQRTVIEYPSNNKTDLVSLSAAPIPLRLWGAGRDLARNETPDRAAEAQAVNESVPQWSYGYRSTAGGTNLTLFTPEQHINDGSGLHGWIAPGQITLGVNTKSTPIVFNTGSGDYKPLLPDQIYMSPGPNHEFLVARWTAPAAGDYRITARWVDLDNHGGNGATAYLFKNGQATLCDDPNESDCTGYVEAFETGPTKLGRARLRARTLSLNAGDVLDFVLGSRGDASFDATGFNAAVRRIPKVTKVTLTPPAENNTYTEGQEIAIDVEVDQVGPIERVEIDDALDVIGTSSEPPFHFVKVFEPGVVHFIRAAARDDRKATGYSRPIGITVKPAGAANTARRTSTSGEAVVAQASRGKYYTAVTNGGRWDNPATWDLKGVPGESDLAEIPRGITVSIGGSESAAQLELRGRLVQAPGTTASITVYDYLTIVGGEVKGIPGAARLEFNTSFGSKAVISSSPAIFTDIDLNLSESELTLVGGGIISERTSVKNNGTFNIQPQPGTQKPVSAAFEVFKHNGGLLAPGPNVTLTAPQGITIAGTVNLTPGHILSDAGVGIVTDNGAGLISDNGAAVIARDGASLVSENGLGLIGNDGSSLRGPDGLPLIGNDGSTLIGNDGSTFVPRRASFAASASAGSEGSDAAAAAAPGQILLAPGAVITGSGELRGDVVNQGGFVAPGHSPGGIVITGNYTQQSGGTLVLELGGKTISPFTYDILQVSGKATLGGNLVVKTINGYVQASGDEVSPLLYDSRTGNFASVSSNAQLTFGATGAEVKVSGPNPQGPRALNISTRLQIQSGDNALFAGFIVTGPAGSTKKVMIRGIGPSLAKFGVSGTISDPLLEFHNGNTTITNDNWQQAPNKNEIPNGFAPGDPKESIVIATLSPGSYSAILKGAHGETGVGLAEVYDLEPNSAAQLANIATRGPVQTGDSVLIGGFIISGNEPAKILVRAIGPSLNPFLAGALQDPTLEVHDANGGVIGNDDWRQMDEAAIQATTIPPNHDKEAAVLAVLAPGSYTAIVRGKDDTTGIAVVEAYNLSQ